MKKIFLMYLLSCKIQFAFAFIYSIPEKGDRLVGKNTTIIVNQNSKLSLENFASKFQIGLLNLLEANPNVDVYLPSPGTKIIIPNKLILPDTLHRGIIVNSAEMRLYFYSNKNKTVVVLPIGIGKLGHHTPLNWITNVKYKRKNPIWIPPKKIKEEYSLHGKILPKVFPPGPNNPMGKYAIYIGNSYAIHGTNVNFGIGLRISHGCIRLRDEDIKYLYYNVPIGTRVEFINEPIKITRESNGHCYLEVHTPITLTEEQRKNKLKNSIEKYFYSEKIQRKLSKIPNINHKILSEELNRQSGIPKKINNN